MSIAKTTNFTVRVDAEKKAEAEKLFADLGMTLSGAFNVFLSHALMVQGLPFAVRRERPNRTTLAAMREAVQLANDPDSKAFSSVDELMKDLQE